MNRKLQKGSNGRNPVTTQVTLNYLNEKQAGQLLAMFDSEDAYNKNFAAIKAITKGFFKAIQHSHGLPDPRIGKMFDTINDMQEILLPEDMADVDSIMREAGL